MEWCGGWECWAVWWSMDFCVGVVNWVVLRLRGEISFKKLTKVESCLRCTAPDNKQNTSAALVQGETMADCAVQLRTYPSSPKAGIV